MRSIYAQKWAGDEHYILADGVPIAVVLPAMKTDHGLAIIAVPQLIRALDRIHTQAKLRGLNWFIDVAEEALQAAGVLPPT